VFASAVMAISIFWLREVIAAVGVVTPISRVLILVPSGCLVYCALTWHLCRNDVRQLGKLVGFT
jgi:hypothetical protein